MALDMSEISASIIIAFLIPLVTFLYTCLLLWATKSLRAGIMSALSFGNAEGLLLLLFLVNISDKMMLFFHAAYAMFLLIFGTIILIKPSLVDERFGNSYPVFVLANIIMVFWFGAALLGYELIPGHPYNEPLATLAGCLFGAVLATRRGRDLINYAQELRRHYRRLFGRPRQP
jgi:hypothetical protein